MTVDERLRLFAGMVDKWSAKINLVSKGDVLHLWERHVEDSLSLRPYMPEGVTRAIDLGSGAGFPGMVLAIATGVAFTLIESDTRKSAFLMEALEKLLGWAAPHLAADGICLFPKGPGAGIELTAAKALWHMDVQRFESPLGGAKCILKVSQIRHVGPS